MSHLAIDGIISLVQYASELGVGDILLNEFKTQKIWYDDEISWLDIMIWWLDLMRYDKIWSGPYDLSYLSVVAWLEG